MEEIELSREFVAPISADEAKARVQEVLVTRGHALLMETVDDWTFFRSGSRFWFRVWGLWGPGAGKRLPAVWKTSVLPVDGDTRIQLELISDPGPYLVRLPAVERAYRREFSIIAGRLETLLLSNDA